MQVLAVVLGGVAVMAGAAGIVFTIYFWQPRKPRRLPPSTALRQPDHQFYDYDVEG